MFKADWRMGIAALMVGCAQAAMATPELYTVQAEAGAGAILGGQVAAKTQVTLSAQAPGRLLEVRVAEGDVIQPGQPLAMVDPGVLPAQRMEALAQLRAMQANVFDANSQYRHQWQSYNPMSSFMNPFAWMGTGMASMMGQGGQNPWTSYLSGIDSRSAGLMGAYAQTDAATARIAQIDASLRDTVTLAPFAGLVLQKHADPGAIVQPGQPLLTIARDRQMQVQVQVPEALVGDLVPGATVSVRAAGDGRAVSTRVAEIAPTTDAKTHTVKVKLDVQDGAPLRPGSYVRVALPNASAEAAVPVIPLSALLPGRSLPAVLVMHDGVGELRVLRIGERSPNDRVQVLSGLRVGEVVLDYPPARARSGFRLSDLVGSEADSAAEEGV